jgi:1,4-alpha-glucan branching enzyme
LQHESESPRVALNADAMPTGARRRQRRAGPLSPIVSSREVTFTFEAPGADHVLLMGEFNDWILDGSEMEPIGGVWTKVIKLAPGRYRYRYVVDGQWQHDPSSAVIEPNPYGGHDSILVIDDETVAWSPPGNRPLMTPAHAGLGS